MWKSFGFYQSEEDTCKRVDSAAGEGQDGNRRCGKERRLIREKG